MEKYRTIIYVNYSPYENSGRILDYLLENFSQVFVFSIGFYYLKNKKNYNRLLVFKNGKMTMQYLLFQLPNSKKFLFILLPVRSLINFIQIIIYSIWLKIKFGKIDLYFSVNAFTAWIGNLMKGMGIVKKTIFWVWDYYPPIHENKIIMLMRYIYWQFDKISSFSDRVVLVNKRLLDLRKDIGIFPKNTNYPIVPIGTDQFDLDLKEKSRIVFGFIGVLKKSHGFGIVFENTTNLLKRFKNVRYEIIGSGPDEEYFKEKAKKSGIKSKFYGYVEGKKVKDILRNCSIGIATYIPDESNVSHFGDPGKIKLYLSFGIPTIATNVLEFSREIEESKSGIIIDYYNKREFTRAVARIMKNYKKYSKNALKLGQKYYYKKIYPEIFKV